MSHAYGHWVSKTVGIRVGESIVRAVVMSPELGQDHNDLVVVTGDLSWHTVPAMSTYRADFIRG